MERKQLGVPGLILLAVGVCMTALAAPAVAQHSDFGLHSRDGFRLGGTAAWTTDPTNPLNKVIKIDVSPSLSGFVKRTLDRGTQVEDLTNQLSFNYRIAGPNRCGHGSPRILLAIDLDGDGIVDGNAVGHAGLAPGFTDCPPDRWFFEEMTSSAPHWELTQFAAILGAIVPTPLINPCVSSTECTWGDVLSVLGSFPNHRVLTATLVDDSDGAFPRGIGFAYYDNIELGDEKLQSPNWRP